MIQTTIDLKPDEFFEEFCSEETSSDYIYRGQSNNYSQHSFIEWQIISSYVRASNLKNISFNSFLNQQLQKDLFEIYYKENKFVTTNELLNTDLLTKLYFLQHYGIPTCLIDFTHDPEIALYFAISSLPAHSGGDFTRDGFPLYYPDNCFISVTGINYKQLKLDLQIKNIDNNINVHYDSYKYKIADKFINNIYLGIDIQPEMKLKHKNNFNITKQESAFIFYDNSKHPKYDLNSFLVDYYNQNKIQLNKPIIKTYRIKYNDIFKPQNSKHPNFKTVFQRLKQKRKIGANLFNDFQGLKYDFTFFNEQ